MTKKADKFGLQQGDHADTRRVSVGNDPILDAQFEARLHNGPMAPGTAPSGLPDRKRPLSPVWMNFLSPDNISWYYAEPLIPIDETLGVWTQLILSQPVIKGQVFVLLEFIPVLLQPMGEIANNYMEEIPPARLARVAAARVSIDGRPSTTSAGGAAVGVGADATANTQGNIITVGSGEVTVFSTRYMNTRAFGSNVNFPVTIYTQSTSILRVEFLYAAGFPYNIRTGMYVGCKLTGFFTSEDIVAAAMKATGSEV